MLNILEKRSLIDNSEKNRGMSEKTRAPSGKNMNKFFVISLLSIIGTILLANYVASLLFGKNSLEVYTSLSKKEIYLKSEIKRLQQENARLQKEYFELKNLEPEL